MIFTPLPLLAQAGRGLQASIRMQLLPPVFKSGEPRLTFFLPASLPRGELIAPLPDRLAGVARHISSQHKRAC